MRKLNLINNKKQNLLETDTILKYGAIKNVLTKVFLMTEKFLCSDVEFLYRFKL